MRYLYLVLALAGCAAHKPLKPPLPQGATVVTVPEDSMPRARNEKKAIELMRQDILNMDVKTSKMDMNLRMEIEKVLLEILKERIE